MMKTIRRPNLFSLYDRSGIVRYLKKMAARGWLLCGMRPFDWKFRRIEPQDLDFSVIYDRKGDDYDFRTSDRQNGMIEMGEEAGWSLAASTSTMQIFWTDDPDTVPMQTDPVSELDSISALMRKTIRNEIIILAILIGLRLLRAGTYLRVILIDMLTDSSFVSGYVALLLLIVAAAAEWIMYFAWRRKAERAAQTGCFVDTPPTRVITIFLIVLVAAFLISQIAPFLKDYPKVTLAILIPTAATLGAMSAAMALAVRILKNKGFSPTKNRLITAGAGFVAGVVLIYVFVSISGTLALPTEPEDYSVNLPVEISIDGIPGAPADSYKTTQKHKATFIAESHIVEQDAQGESSGAPYMHYRITEIKTGLFRDSIIMKAMNQFSSGRSVTENASLWGADRALQATVYSGMRSNYMLVYGNYILDIDFSWKPTAEQKAHIGQIMQSIVSGQ